MKSKFTVLVTGVGAIIGYGIVKSLRASRYACNIIGMDIYDDAVGRIWCDSFSKGVRADSNCFQDHIHRINKQHDIKLIIPGIEQDIQALSPMRESLSSLGIAVALNSDFCIDTFSSKMKTHAFLVKHHLPCLETLSAAYVKSSEILKYTGYPCIAKLDKSTAGKGQSIIHSEREVTPYKGNGQYLLQRFVKGDNVKEFTASAFGLGDGSFVNLITLERSLGADGATHKAKVTTNQFIESQIDTICRFCKPVGPTNFQFIYDDERDEYYLLEVNPRISSSSSIRTAFGVNEAQMCVEYYLLQRKPDIATIKSGQAQRFIADNIEYDCADF